MNNTSGQGDEYGGPLAQHSEYRPGDKLPYLRAGQHVTGKILHVSNGEGGQLYTVENLVAGWPDTVLASEIDVQA